MNRTDSGNDSLAGLDTANLAIGSSISKSEKNRQLHLEITRLSNMCNNLKAENAALIRVKENHKNVMLSVSEVQSKLNNFRKEYHERFRALKSAMVEYNHQATRKAVSESMADSVYFGPDATASSTNNKLTAHVKELERTMLDLSKRLQREITATKDKEAQLKVTII